MNLALMLDKHRFYLSFFLFALGPVSWAVAQEKPQLETRWVRWRLIEVARKSLADSILAQLQQGVSFQKLARKHSLHASAKEGGEMGWAALDSVDSDFKTAIVSLPIGGTSAILQKGNHLFILYKIKDLAQSGYSQWKRRKSKADSLLNKIESLTNTGNNPAAMTLIKEAEEHVKQIEDEGAYLRLLNLKGTALMGLSQFMDAENLFDSTLKISRASGDNYWEGVALGNLGIVYYWLDAYQRTIAYSDSALVIAREISDRKNEGRWLGSLGNAYRILGQYQRSIVHYDSALTIAREIGDRQGEGRALRNLGNSYLSLGQLPQAVAYYDSALVIARKIGDRSNVRACLSNLGLTHASVGQYLQAIAYYDSALVIARSIGDRALEGSGLVNLSDAYHSLGQNQRAIAYCDSGLVIARKIGDRTREERILNALGNFYLSLNQNQRAIAYYDSALVIARKIGDRSGEGACLSNLGSSYSWLSQYQRAIAYFDSALVIKRKIGDRREERFVLANLGAVCFSLGQYQRAIAYCDSALIIAREFGDHENEGRWLGNLGVVYYWLGQYSWAIAYYDSALAVAQKIGARAGEARSLGNLGNVYFSLGQYQRASAYLDNALVIFREIGNREGEGKCLGNLGIVYFSLGQYQRAIAYCDSALVIQRKVGDREGEGILLGDLSDAYHDLGQYNHAIAYADSGLFIAEEIGDAESIWRRYWSLAKSHSKMPEAQKNEVISFYDNAVDALESITGQLSKDVHKLSFLEKKRKLYHDFINYLIAQAENPYYEKALEISEASRTRALKDLLQGQRIQVPLAVEKRVAATKRTEELFRKFASAQIAQAEFSDALRAGVDDSLETWATQILIPPDTLGSTEGAPAIRMREIQAEAKTSTLLEYHILDDGVAIWVVSQSSKVFSFKQNIPKAKLQALIDSARQVLGVAGFGDRNVKAVGSGRETRTPLSKPVLQTLDSLLIQPVSRYLPPDSNRELIILPHDILFLLPFACLIDSSGKYFAERYTFSTAPSVGLLKFTRGRIREQQYREKPKLLLMGNPVMPDAKRWPPLLGAEQEVKRIAQNVNQRKGAGFQAKGALSLQALPLIKVQATEAEFRQIAGIQNYLHLATHGYVVSDALRSGLVLAKTGKTMETDGILTTAEIFGLPLNAELVVLSACQTGVGEISSDGVAGLSRAFLYAGASSLIVSLWKVSDEATQFLMVKFYEELARDGNKARALRAAQLFTMKKYPHPKDWAAFVLVGQPK